MSQPGDTPSGAQKLLGIPALVFGGLFLNAAIMICGMKVPLPPDAPPGFLWGVAAVLLVIPAVIVGAVSFTPPRTVGRKWSGLMLMIVGGFAAFGLLTMVRVSLDPAVKQPVRQPGDPPVPDIRAMVGNWPFGLVAAGVSLVLGWLLYSFSRPRLDEEWPTD